MQWNFVSSSNLPEPGEQVLGLWLDGFWKKLAYSPNEGWYTARDGVEQSPPVYWARVNTAIAEQLPPQGEVGPKGEEGPPLALDVSLEKARALHRVWRALNDGDCPNCHRFHAATEILRWPSRIVCPSCDFTVLTSEIAKIEQMFAPAMNAAVAIFNAWRAENNNKLEQTAS